MSKKKKTNDTKDTKSSSVEEKITKIEARRDERLKEISEKIAWHAGCIQSLEERKHTIESFTQKRIAAIREKGDPKIKTQNAIMKLKAKIAEYEKSLAEM